MLARANNVDVFMRSVRKFFIAVALVLGCQVPLARSLSVRKESTRSRALSAHKAEQDPGPMPAYVKYGPPEFTTFSNVTTACQACMEFWPVKEDGKRFHQALYEDKESGGTWERSCRAGKCDFRDPQTDPVGGIIGKGVGPGGKPDGRTCITRDPVPWYSDCDPILRESAQTLLDVTRYCSYREQMFIPPPAGSVSRFGGKVEAWARIGGTHEQCLVTIEKQGAALLDGMSFCDSDLPALSGCCETVYSSLSCVAELSVHSEEGVFAQMGSGAQQMLESFSKYCVPLCQYTKPEFCAKPEYAGSDICVNPSGCTECTVRGGLWCPKLKSCHCPSKNPPCIAPPITTPMQCLGPSTTLGPGGGAPKPMADVSAPQYEEGDDSTLCKYKEFAQKWKPRD